MVCNLIEKKYKSPMLSTKYTLKCAKSVENPDLYRLRFLELVQNERDIFLTLLKPARITAINEPTYIGDTPFPLTPTALPTSAPSKAPTIAPTIAPTVLPSMSPSVKPTITVTGGVGVTGLFYQTFIASSALTDSEKVVFEKAVESVAGAAADFLGDRTCKPTCEFVNQIWQPVSLKLVVEYRLTCSSSLPDPSIYKVVYPQIFPRHDITAALESIGLTILTDPAVF